MLVSFKLTTGDALPRYDIRFLTFYSKAQQCDTIVLQCFALLWFYTHLCTLIPAYMYFYYVDFGTKYLE